MDAQRLERVIERQTMIAKPCVRVGLVPQDVPLLVRPVQTVVQGARARA